MAYAPELDLVPPAAVPGTRLVAEAGRLLAVGGNLPSEGLPVDPARVVSTTALRDPLGYRTVIHIAGGEDIVLAQDHASASLAIANARRA